MTWAATGVIAGQHHRMPVILNADEQGAWLGGSDAVVSLAGGAKLTFHPVAPFGFQDDSPELIEHISG